jgi:hypothetical protein
MALERRLQMVMWHSCINLGRTRDCPAVSEAEEQVAVRLRDQRSTGFNHGEPSVNIGAKILGLL